MDHERLVIDRNRSLGTIRTRDRDFFQDSISTDARDRQVRAGRKAQSGLSLALR